MIYMIVMMAINKIVLRKEVIIPYMQEMVKEMNCVKDGKQVD